MTAKPPKAGAPRSGAHLAPPKTPNKEKKRDVALVLGTSEDGSKVATLRQRGDHLEAAVLSQVKEGESIHGELVQLRPREEPNLYDVETLVAAPTPAPRTAPVGRPAQVANKGYRSGWGRVFGRGKSKPSLN